MSSKNTLQPINAKHTAQTNKQINNVVGVKRTALLCFSHLRWDFVYQRPQHIMSKFASEYAILFIEEPIYSNEDEAYLEVREVKTNIHVLQPRIPKSFSMIQIKKSQSELLDKFLLANIYETHILWYFTPMSISWTKHLCAAVTVYDCMDELTAFKDAPIGLRDMELELIHLADLIFTGGGSLYKAKCGQHPSVHLFPSSVDFEHFSIARNQLAEPADQMRIPHPRIGFYGVIDERFDICLIENLAKYRTDWNFIFIGPVVKIDPESLPKSFNIYYLQSKTYEELPYYLSGWDVALIPFAMNDSTKFISPTKTPEYLAGGKPVVSTPIRDVVSTYKGVDVVYIAEAENLPKFINAIESGLKDSQNPKKVHEQANFILRNMSWDKTFMEMYKLILEVQNKKEIANEHPKQQIF